MVPFNEPKQTAFERILERYETTRKKCPSCGYVDEEGNWSSETDGRRVVYRHACPSCAAIRKHVFRLDR